MRITIRDVVNIDYRMVVESIREFIEHSLKESGATEVVFGLSGGLDSSTLLRLLVECITRNNIVALIMPDTRVTPLEDTRDAVELAESYGVRYYVINIDEIVDAYRSLPFYDESILLPTGNLRARVRMTILYYYANLRRALVVGSSNRSEILIGYYTKHGDGAADLYPLSCLYKTQVRELAKILGLPEKIVYKPSAPRLWLGHEAEKELGYKYEEIDLALYTLFDLNMNVEEAVEATGLPRELFEKVLYLHRSTRHKRTILQAPSLPWLERPLKEI